jgi:L-ribulose-5-phosphate 3-epimerase UlaE
VQELRSVSHALDWEQKERARLAQELSEAQTRLREMCVSDGCAAHVVDAYVCSERLIRQAVAL